MTQEYLDRYFAAAYRVQMLINANPDKSGNAIQHLAVGVKCAENDMKAFRDLLVERGLLTKQDVDKVSDSHIVRSCINATMVNISAIATLMIEKGYVTVEEYYRAVAEAMEKEAESHERRLMENKDGETAH